MNYLAAPTSSGKTACILPAFLENTIFTYYFYMAFDNNDENYFRHEGAIMEDAEKHGAYLPTFGLAR